MSLSSFCFGNWCFMSGSSVGRDLITIWPGDSPTSSVAMPLILFNQALEKLYAEQKQIKEQDPPFQTHPHMGEEAQENSEKK